MVTSCAVVGCKSSWNPFTVVSFHRVTKNKKLLNLWLRVVDLRLNDHAKICSLHFRPMDLVDCGDGKKLKRDAVPVINIPSDVADDSDDDSVEDEEDNENLSILRKLLTSDSNNGTTATRAKAVNSTDKQPHKFEMVMSCACNSAKANVPVSKKMHSIGLQANKTTNKEIALRQRVKVLGQSLKRKEAKISYMKTVLNMIKKNVKGTDLEYKLSCELHNISNFSEPITINAVKNTASHRQTKPKSPVSDCHDDDEESSADENGMFCEVALSPNLKSHNGFK